MGFRPSACDTPSEGPEYIKRCFVSVQEPEKLLDEISQLTLPYGEPTMSWRQDVGFWVSIYRLKSGRAGGPDADLLFSLIAPGLSSSLQQEDKLKNEGTYAWYILGPHS